MTTMRILGGVDTDGRGLSLGIEDGVQGSPDASSPYLDATGLTIVPGFVDIQINGAFGWDFTEDPSSIWKVGERLPASGVTAFCPTIITAAAGTIGAAQRAMAERPNDYSGAEPIGLHIEGPYLSKQKRGTHPVEHLRMPSARPFPTDHITIVTLAPELPGALELVEDLVDEGVTVSIGHSAATADEARAAIDAGATLGTHLFNAMPPVTAREPGIAGVLLADDRAHFGFIADGHHHDPAVTKFAWRAAPDRFVLITDAMAAAGMPDGEYTIGQVGVTLAEGAVRNAEGNLAGAASMMDRNLGVLMDATGASLTEVIPALTFNPSEAVKRWDLGRIRRGAKGDLTLLSGRRVVCTVARGVIVHSTEPDRWTGSPHAAH